MGDDDNAARRPTGSPRSRLDDLRGMPWLGLLIMRGKLPGIWVKQRTAGREHDDGGATGNVVPGGYRPA